MMKSKSLPILAGAAALGLSAGFANPASATITESATPIFQQQQNSPCVIGDNSCKQNGFADIEFSGTPGGMNGSTYDIVSPTYTAANQTPVTPPTTIPTAFTIGVDDNFAMGAGNEVLVSFNTYVCTANCGTITPGLVSTEGDSLAAANFNLNAANSFHDQNFSIPETNNGNGFSNLVLNGFSLTAGDQYIFEARVSNDADGMEEFFLIPSNVTPVPAPLIGHGLLVLIAVGGVLFGGRFLESLKKRHFQAA
jgi:hypothetical protein